MDGFSPGGSLVLLIALAFVTVFAALWIGITYLLGRASEWFALQRIYPDTGQAALTTLRMQSAAIGVSAIFPVSFNNCLTLEACPAGLRFRLWKALGAFQRPFFVPWPDISAEERRQLLGAAVDLRFANWLSGRVTLRRRTFDQLARGTPLQRLL